MRQWIRSAGVRILDNAMLYKDMTQWLRNKTFLVLFFGLLAVAEGLSLFIMALGEEVERPGSAVFYVLYFVLLMYGVVVAFMGHGLTSREFQNRTFELYELSGMSLERMIGGKFLSMIYQFFFGFFCVVPFMFFAYFLGGLDFLDILSGVVLAALLVPPAYLIALLSALTTKLKQISTLGKIGAIGLVIAAVVFGVISLFNRHFFGRELFEATTAVLKMILSGDWEALTGTVVFLVFYSQICLLLFYLCCHMVSRETDSREIALKVLSLTLIASWFSFVAFVSIQNGHYRNDNSFVALIPTFGLLCFISLMMFFSPIRIPVIVQNRYRTARGLLRLVYRLFQPGPVGLLRFLIMIVGLCALYALLMHYCLYVGWIGPYAGQSYHEVLTKSRGDWSRMFSYIVQIPFFVAFPIGFLTAFFPKVRENVVVQRTLVACWWGFAGAVVAFYATWARMYRTDYKEPLDLLCAFISPISSLTVNCDVQSMLYGELGTLIRLGTGCLGIVLMSGILRRRTAEEGISVRTGNTASSHVDTGAPA